MVELIYSSPSDAPLIFNELKTGAIMVHLGNVYAIVALPTEKGVKQIDRLKKRLPGKSYGSMVHDLRRFIDHSNLTSSDADAFIKNRNSSIENCFLRLPWVNSVPEQLTMNGTHQGLILQEPFKSFAREIEKLIEKEILEDQLIGFHWLICSSANISGDPKGSITNYDGAIKFGTDQEIPLLVKFKIDNSKYSHGSFPIFSIQNGCFSLTRNGPYEEENRLKLAKLGFREII